MNSLNSTPSDNSLTSLEEGMARIGLKLARLQEELNTIQAERAEMEQKITEAQSRIQKILTRLPKPEDTRQMNLLDGGSETVAGESS